MAQRYLPQKRLLEAFKLFPPLGKTQFTLTRIGDNNEETPSGEIIDLQDAGEELADLAKRKLGPSVMTLTDKPRDASIKAAFEAAKLDPDDPYHWRTLMHFFAWAHFGDKNRRGAPTKWDSLHLQKLLNDFEELKSKNTAMSDDRVLSFLGKNEAYQARDGGPLSTSQLRKLLKQARDPKHNELLEARDCSPDNS